MFQSGCMLIKSLLGKKTGEEKIIDDGLNSRDFDTYGESTSGTKVN